MVPNVPSCEIGKESLWTFVRWSRSRRRASWLAAAEREACVACAAAREVEKVLCECQNCASEASSEDAVSESEASSAARVACVRSSERSEDVAASSASRAEVREV
jgi:hypothetical protein